MAGEDNHGWPFPMMGKRYIPSFMRSTLVEQPDQGKGNDDYPVRKRQVTAKTIERFLHEFEAENKGSNAGNQGADELDNNINRTVHPVKPTLQEPGESNDARRVQLTKRVIFEQMLEKIVPGKNDILEAMIFALENSDSAEEISRILTSSLTTKGVPLRTVICRLTLLSNVLHSKNTSYLLEFEKYLPSIMASFHYMHVHITGDQVARVWKERVLKVLQDWHNWSLYSNDYLNDLHNIFQGSDQCVKAEIDKKSNCKDADSVCYSGVDMDGDLATG